ncbi:MAG: CPBP family intramembrane metalloprotease, partial [Candidatus Krumholzibacteria bacterium]|nr:CPBP family intramembrane metalloprotease [Candidatus Krumholzibacteria bacterium]
MRDLEYALRANKFAQVGEIAVVFAVPVAAIAFVLPLVGENPLARQAVVWVANLLMLGLVWAGLRLRGQGWAHFGLGRRVVGRRAVVRAVLKSLVVFVAAVVALLVGSIVMANIVGKPEAADMSGYDYLRGNLPMLLLALVGVYIVSSLGEEIVYRGFLINRLAELGSGGKAAWRWAVV